MASIVDNRLDSLKDYQIICGKEASKKQNVRLDVKA